MIRFAEPAWLWALALIPVAIGSLLWAQRRRRLMLARLAAFERLDELAPGSWGGGRRTVQGALIWAGVISCGLALARPQFGFRNVVTRSRGIDLVVALDLSRSMLAEDFKPSRLERAKAEIRALIHQVRGHRVGLVGFTTLALPLSPLTVDGRHVALQLERIRSDTLPSGGTDLSAGIEGALALLKDLEGAGRAVVVFTDGEDHGGAAKAAAENAARAGVTVHVVGLGAREGHPIPAFVEGRREGYVRDRAGRTVLSKMDAASLQDVASAGNGVAALPGPSGFLDLAPLTARIEGMTARDSEARTRKVHIERYRWALWPAVLLVFLSFVIRPTSGRRGFGFN
ncbi:MAG: VWA domain-containing protein [Myxococcota bacterium]